MQNCPPFKDGFLDDAEAAEACKNQCNTLFVNANVQKNEKQMCLWHDKTPKQGRGETLCSVLGILHILFCLFVLFRYDKMPHCR